ncbi:PQQ-binding-like beta-propeller repeat protein [Rubinisphaera italica]|uniref:Outer membrane protein assembly factor BamB n=1 Tax=Rubinisphaera italica TaxID=2527969 RepID=A0A5C5XPL6_9PLAN|nr:PQQ-binding-like beta-propeller repeat protein [Rubinisphaera italica]TWT64411.1 Outer membrane protein assembly factor BamB [Rubinisphaera italica]
MRNLVVVVSLICLAGCNAQPEFRVEPQVLTSKPKHLSFHPDDPSLCLVVSDADVSVWSLSDPKKPLRVGTLPASWTAKFLPGDESRIVAAGKDGSMRVWDSSGQPISEPFTNPALQRDVGDDGKQAWWINQDSVTGLDISPDGTRLVARTWGGGAFRWRLKPKPELAGEVDSSLFFAPDEDATLIRRITAGDNSFHYVREDGTNWCEPLTGLRKELQSSFVAMLASEPRIVAVEEFGRVLIWTQDGSLVSDSIAPHQEDYFNPHNPFVKRLAFSKANGSIVTVGEDTGTQLWTSGGIRLGQLETAGGYYVDDVEFNSDGSIIGFVESGEYHSENSTVRFWQPTGKIVSSVVPCKGLEFDHDGEVNSLLWISEDVVVTGGRDGTIRVLDPTKRATTQSWEAHASVVGLSHDDKTQTIISVGAEGRVRFWSYDGSEKRDEVRLPDHPDCVALSSDCRTLAMSFIDQSQGYDRRLVTIDLNNGELGSEFNVSLEGRGQLAESLLFTKDGEHLFAGLGSGVVRKFHVADGSLEAEHDLHPETQFGRGAVCDLEIAPAGNLLASAGADGRVVVFDLDHSLEVASSFHTEVPKFYPRQIRQLAWSPDGSALVTLAVDGTLVVWTPDLSVKSKPIQIDGAAPNCLHFTGNNVVSAGLLGHIRVATLGGDVRTFDAGHGTHTGKGANGLVANGIDRLYTAGLNGKVSAWNLDGEFLAESHDGHATNGHLSIEEDDFIFEKITRITIERESGTVFTCGIDGRILSHDADLKSSRQVALMKDVPAEMLVSSDGQHVFIATEDGGLLKMRTKDGSQNWHTMVGENISSLEMDSDLQNVVVQLGSESNCLVDAETGQVVSAASTDLPPATLSASNNEKYVLALAGDGNLAFKGRAAKSWTHWPIRFENVTSSAISDDGNRVALLRMAASDWRGNSVVELFSKTGVSLGLIELPSSCDAISFVDGHSVIAAVGRESLHFIEASARELCSLVPAYKERAIVDVGHKNGLVAVGEGKRLTLFSCDGHRLWTREFRDSIKGVDILGESGSLLVHNDEDIWVVDCDTGQESEIARRKEWGKPSCHYVSEDAGVIVIGCIDGAVELYALSDDGPKHLHRLSVFEVVKDTDGLDPADWPYEESPAISFMGDDSLPPTYLLMSDMSFDDNDSGSVVAVAVHDDCVYAMSASGTICCVSRNDGRVLGSPFQLPEAWDLDKNPKSTSLTPLNDCLLLEDDDRQLLLDNDMNQLWSYTPRFVFNTLEDDVLESHFWCIDGGQIQLMYAGDKGGVRTIRSRQFDMPMTLVASSESGAVVSPQFDAPAFDSGSTTLHFVDRELNQVGSAIVGNNGLLITMPDGRFAGTGYVFDTARVFEAGKTVPLPSADGFRLAAAVDVGHELTNKTTIAASLASQLLDLAQRVGHAYLDAPVIVKAAVWPTLVYSLTLMAVLGLWIAAPARLAELAMSRVGDEGQSNLQKFSRFFTLIYFLGHSRRAVDSWMKKHFDTLDERCLKDCAAYKERQRYVDLGYEDQSQEWFKRLSNGNSGGVWLYGPGGRGKSTMAFEIARRVNSSRKTPFLTFLVAEDWAGDLVELMCDRLHTDDKRPTRSMVEGLLHRKRIIVVLDGASERRVVSDKQVLAGTAGSESEALCQVRSLMEKGILRCLIVTSRHLPPKKRVFERFCLVELGPISEAKLEGFVRAYVSEEEFEDVYAAVSALAFSIDLSPLMARMAIEVARHSEAVTSNFAQLAIDYVLALRSQSADTLCEQDFIRVVKEVAHLCVEDEATSGEVCFYELRGYLKGKAEASPYTTVGQGDDSLPIADVINELVKSGLIEMNRTRDRVGFCADPIAEYMAAWAICDSPSELKRFRSKIRMLQKNRGEDFATGLSRALDDVDATRQHETNPVA